MALFRIPVAVVRGTIFEYQGTELTLAPLRVSPYIGAGVWTTDLTWIEDELLVGVYGIVVSAGVDLLAQYSTPIPSLFALNINNPREDITNTDELGLYIKEKET